MGVFQSVKAHYHDCKPGELRKLGQYGVFTFDVEKKSDPARTWLWIVPPYSTERREFHLHALLVYKPHEGETRPLENVACWEWDGNVESPTLSPSISCCPENGEEKWHGFLRNGELVSV